MTDLEYIDNDPCFLITLDRGIFYLYGAAKVNRRVVCSCLLSLEFTSHFFNIGGFTETLYKCLSAIYFFYEKFAARISKMRSSEDSQHLEYYKIKSTATLNDQPYPAILSVEAEGGDSSERIMFTFQKVAKTIVGAKIDEAAYFKPCVYMVKMGSDRNAVLKLAYNYNIEVHRKLADVELAPKIIGYEKLCGCYHIILMEYMGDSYESVFNHLQNSRNAALDRDKIYESLGEILVKIKNLRIVHGDFRSANILAKRSVDDPSLLEDFKLIDFELSGEVDEPYPFLALRNQRISWPMGFHSYMPRKFDHDVFMLNEMNENELKK